MAKRIFYMVDELPGHVMEISNQPNWLISDPVDWLVKDRADVPYVVVETTAVIGDQDFIDWDNEWTRRSIELGVYL